MRLLFRLQRSRGASNVAAVLDLFGVAGAGPTATVGGVAQAVFSTFFTNAGFGFGARPELGVQQVTESLTDLFSGISVAHFVPPSFDLSHKAPILSNGFEYAGDDKGALQFGGTLRVLV